MTRLLLLTFSLWLTACSAPYGGQSCNKSTECTSPQVCNLCNTRGDAGMGVTTSGLCRQTCASDRECNDLGLKKPTCGGDTCGSKFCIDNPF